MRVEGVQHDLDARGAGRPMVHQLLDERGPVDRRPTLGDGDPSSAAQRLTHQEDVRGALPFVLVVVPLRNTRPRGQGPACLPHPLLARLVHADQGAVRIVRLRVELQRRLHAPDTLGPRLRGNAPVPLPPRLPGVFFSVWRTVSREIESPMSHSTRRFPQRRNVQRSRPAGGLRHAVATSVASACPSSRRWREGCACGVRRKAASTPSSTHRWRIRAPVAGPPPRQPPRPWPSPACGTCLGRP